MDIVPIVTMEWSSFKSRHFLFIFIYLPCIVVYFLHNLRFDRSIVAGILRLCDLDVRDYILRKCWESMEG